MDALDERLSASAPVVGGGDGHLDSLLNDMVMETVGSRRRRRAVLISGVLSGVLVMGGASAALASPAITAWLGWTPDREVQTISLDGKQCVAGYAIQGEGVPDSDPAVQAARTVLIGIDFDNLPITAATRQAAEQRVARRDASIGASGLDAKEEAISMTVVDLIRQGVTARDLDVGKVSLQGGINCDTTDAR